MYNKLKNKITMERRELKIKLSLVIKNNDYEKLNDIMNSYNITNVDINSDIKDISNRIYNIIYQRGNKILKENNAPEVINIKIIKEHNTFYIIDDGIYPLKYQISTLHRYFNKYIFKYIVNDIEKINNFNDFILNLLSLNYYISTIYDNNITLERKKCNDKI